MNMADVDLVLLQPGRIDPYDQLGLVRTERQRPRAGHAAVIERPQVHLVILRRGCRREGQRDAANREVDRLPA